MSAQNQYVIGQQIRLDGTFKDLAGNKVDPSAVTIQVKLPDDSIITDADGRLTAPSSSVTGEWFSLFDPDAEGVYEWKMAGTSGYKAAAIRSLHVDDRGFT